MVVGEVAERAEVVVIGSGPGGYVAALRCADQGKHTVLVDRGPIGGACLNVGCIPSKVLIHGAELAASPIAAAGTGVSLTADVDAAALLQHSDGVVASLTSGVRGLLESAGVEIWSGEARFSKPNRLAVVDGPLVRHLEFNHCVVATGSRPAELDVLPVDGVRVVDSTGALRLDRVPERMVVVGGGYIGVELGTAWAKLGSHVTVVEAAERILPAMDPLVSRAVARRMAELGIDVQTGTRVTSSQTGAAGVQLTLSPTARPGTEQRSASGTTGSTENDNDNDNVATTTVATTTVAADVAVVAVGRRPNTDQLGLDAAGVEITRSGHIVVASDRSAARRIYAIGDVTEGPALAHKASAEAEVAARAIGGAPAAFDPAGVPEVVFSDPEVACVGFTPAAAIDAGIDASVFRFPFSAGARARTLGDTAGFVQLVSDEVGSLIGAQMVGAGAAEMLGEATLALELGATVEDLGATIHAHPTMSEGIAEAAHGLLGHPLHVRTGTR